MKYFITSLITLLALSVLAISCHKPRDYDYSRWYADPNAGIAGKTVTVMTFNVRAASSTADTGERNWTARRPAVKAMLSEKSPVIMGTQECDIIQRKNILEDDSRYAAIGIDLNGPKEECEECAVFYMKDSVDVLDHGTFYLTSTPDVPSRMPQVGHYRVCTWGKFKFKSDGTEFYYFNTHLEYSAAAARGPELGIILNRMGAIVTDNLPIIFTGDYNTEEDDSIFEAVKSFGFKSARLNAAVGDSFKTFNGYGDYGSGQTLDHCWYKGIKSVSNFTTIRDKWAGVTYISDHYPVSITLKF